MYIYAYEWIVAIMNLTFYKNWWDMFELNGPIKNVIQVSINPRSMSFGLILFQDT